VCVVQVGLVVPAQREGDVDSVGGPGLPVVRPAEGCGRANALKLGASSAPAARIKLESVRRMDDVISVNLVRE